MNREQTLVVLANQLKDLRNSLTANHDIIKDVSPQEIDTLSRTCAAILDAIKEKNTYYKVLGMATEDNSVYDVGERLVAPVLITTNLEEAIEEANKRNSLQCKTHTPNWVYYVKWVNPVGDN